MIRPYQELKWLDWTGGNDRPSLFWRMTCRLRWHLYMYSIRFTACRQELIQKWSCPIPWSLQGGAVSEALWMKPCTRPDSSAEFLTHVESDTRGMIVPSSAGNALSNDAFAKVSNGGWQDSGSRSSPALDLDTNAGIQLANGAESSLVQLRDADGRCMNDQCSHPVGNFCGLVTLTCSSVICHSATCSCALVWLLSVSFWCLLRRLKYLRLWRFI